MCKGLFKYSSKHKNIVINSNYNHQYYNLQINPYSYNCFGICDYKGVFIYNVIENKNKLSVKVLYEKCQLEEKVAALSDVTRKYQDLSKNYYPNFCFLYSLNEKNKSKFIVSINPGSVILNEINSDFTKCIQLKEYLHF